MHRDPECNVCHCGSHAWAPTTKHRVAIVDECDRHLFERFAWHTMCHKRLTPYAGSGKAPNYIGHRLLHRAVLDVPSGVVVDHINGNGLDCRRVNLRVCTQKQNTHNRRPTRGSTSKYRGVSWNKRDQRWIVQITVNGRNKCLGRFLSEDEAAAAYDEAAMQAYGSFARLNFQAEHAS